MHISARVVFVILLVCYALVAKSQNQILADSIKAHIGSQRLSPEELMNAYYYLSAYSSSPEEELKYGQQLLELAEKSNSREYRIKAYQRIGVANRLMGNLDMALEYLFKSADEAAGIKAFIPLLADIYTEISTCYTQNSDSENALRYGLKTIEMLRKTDRKQELAINLLNIGYDYYLIGTYDSAMNYYNESEQILSEIDFPIGTAYMMGNRALVFWKTKDNNRAKKDLFEAINMLEPYGDLYGMADYYNQLGNIHLEEKDYKKAIRYTLKSLEMAKDEGLKEQVRDASYLLFQLYQKVGDHEKAITFQTQYNAYKDSIQSIETTQRLADLRTSFEVGRKQAEVDLLLAQRRSNQIIMITGGIILLIVIILAIIIYQYSTSKIKLNKQLEEQKNDLIDLNNTKDKFFSIISHDLRGPVNNMSGLVSVSKRFLDENNTERLKEMVGNMEHSMERLVKLLDNLLHWALFQRGRFPHEPENINPKALLHEVSDMFTDMAAAKKIKLDISQVANFEVYADKNTTSTIFRNLLSNAIKFTSVDGRIKIMAEENGSTGVIKFVDNGVGIPDEKLKILFDLNDNITTRGTSGETGLGLGLQLVYDFVHLNKGEIEVESKEGVGTTFTLHLPKAKDNSESKITLEQ